VVIEPVPPESGLLIRIPIIFPLVWVSGA